MSLTIDGDLSQMATQRNFLIGQGLSIRLEGVYPIIEESEVALALEFIWKDSIAGWWHYLDKYIEYGICTKKEFDHKLWRK